LNNPRRPLEASGTSGQKVVLNGGLNLYGAGWMVAEAYDGMNGVSRLEPGERIQHERHDMRDGEDLHRLWREEVIPLYYQRDQDGLRGDGSSGMKRTIPNAGVAVQSDRMVMDYTLKCYVPAGGIRVRTRAT